MPKGKKAHPAHKAHAAEKKAMTVASLPLPKGSVSAPHFKHQAKDIIALPGVVTHA